MNVKLAFFVLIATPSLFLGFSLTTYQWITADLGSGTTVGFGLLKMKTSQGDNSRIDDIPTDSQQGKDALQVRSEFLPARLIYQSIYPPTLCILCINMT
jgi:hypothetical protein